MKVLVLSPTPEPILLALKRTGDEGIVTMDRPGLLPEGDFLVSFGYRHILPQIVLDRFPNTALNIHLGYLPFNRGAHPNFFSWWNDTQKGVSIHHMTSNVDDGPIAARVKLEVWHPSTTLKSSYWNLWHCACNLFDAAWEHVREGGYDTIAVDSRDGTYHRVKDLPFPIQEDMLVSEVAAAGRRHRANGGKT